MSPLGYGCSALLLRALMTRWAFRDPPLVEYSSKSWATATGARCSFPQAAISRMDNLNQLISVMGKPTGALSLYSPHLPLASIAARAPYLPCASFVLPLLHVCSLCLSLSCPSFMLCDCQLPYQATLRSFLFTRSPRWMPKYSKQS